MNAPPPGLSSLAWRKSSRSGSNANCVELASVPDAAGVAVRDSKNPDGPALFVERADWATFVAVIKRSG